MLVKFIKYCPWSFGGRIVKFSEGIEKHVPDTDAFSMIENGYAVKVLPKKPVEPREPGERYNFYSNKFSVNGLKAFCRENGLPIKSHIHQTKPKIINLILEFEEKNGLIITKENNE